MLKVNTYDGLNRIFEALPDDDTSELGRIWPVISTDWSELECITGEEAHLIVVCN